MIRVKEEPDLARTSRTTIQNINNEEYRTFIARRNAAKDTKERIEKLEIQGQELNGKLDAILELLRGNK